jgi:hypothetical protein
MNNSGQAVQAVCNFYKLNNSIYQFSWSKYIMWRLFLYNNIKTAFFNILVDIYQLKLYKNKISL